MIALAAADRPVGIIFILVGLAIIFTVLGFLALSRARSRARRAGGTR